VIQVADLEVQHTTFRAEQGYADARRPDAVRFGASLEEDARRRDFTCNALYLDPLRDELVDPQGGLEDLAQGGCAAWARRACASRRTA
jgi:tRNA nucleotidyltransferase/poly(A) polymerase